VHYAGKDDEYMVVDHVIPEKHEHELDQDYDPEESDWDYDQNILSDYEEEEGQHVAPRKSEHHLEGLRATPSDLWRPQFHSVESPDYQHHYEVGQVEDGIEEEEDIAENYLNESPDEPKPKPAMSRKLAPKKPNLDDPRIKIPKGKATEEHDHVIVPKEPVPTAEHKEQYGHAYENQRKEAMKGNRTSAGLAPKLPEDQAPIKLHKAIEVPHNRKPCSAYGLENRCEGMSCERDD